MDLIHTIHQIEVNMIKEHLPEIAQTLGKEMKFWGVKKLRAKAKSRSKKDFEIRTQIGNFFANPMVLYLMNILESDEFFKLNGHRNTQAHSPILDFEDSLKKLREKSSGLSALTRSIFVGSIQIIRILKLLQVNICNKK